MRKTVGNKGYAILAAVFILVLFALLGMAGVSLIAGSAGMAADEIKSQQAFDLAGAGLEFDAARLMEISDWSGETGYTKSFGPGSFAISYLSLAPNSATVVSAGTVGGITRTVRQDFAGGGAGSGPKAYASAMYTETNITVHQNATGDVYGPVSAGGTVQDDRNVTFHDPVEENNPNASVPTPLWAYWQSVATEVTIGNRTFNSGTYSGIYYVTGRVTIPNGASVNISGTIVALGRVTFGNNSTVMITASGTNPAIYAGQRLEFNNGCTVNITGWAQSQQYVSIGANVTLNVTGGIASGSYISIGNNADITVTYDSSRAPTVGFTGGEQSSGGIIKSNWRELL